MPILLQHVSLPGMQLLCCTCICLTIGSLVMLQIMKATGIKGPRMKQITEKLMHWQLAHPDATKEDAEQYLSVISG